MILSSTPPKPQFSIAVLPFVNRSADPDNEYFSDGITEEIIHALAKDGAIKVIARSSVFTYKNKQVDAREVGRRLGVSTLLEGSVRKAGRRVRISAQLIETESGSQLWSKNFDRELEDIFRLQDELSVLIADQIRQQFGHFEIPEPASSPPTRRIDAYERYLKGSFHFKRKDFADIQLAERYFKAAIAADDQYAEAYAYLAETYLHLAGFGLMESREAHELARNTALKSIRLQPKTARAHKVMAYIHFFYDWDWNAARKAYEAAVAAGLTGENEFITYYYVFLEKDYERALAIAEQVVEQDPLHSISHWQLGLCHYFAAQFTAAIKTFERAILLDEHFAEAHRWRGLALAQTGQFAEAIASVQHALQLSQGKGPAAYNLLQVRALMGERETVLAAMAETEYLDACDPAELYALLGMQEEAIDCLELAFTQRSTMMVGLKHYWVWDDLREHPRFERLYQRMNFGLDRNDFPSSPEWHLGKVKPQKALLNAEEREHYLRTLTHLVQEERAYLNAELSLRTLAAALEVHPNKLSWLLNQAVGKNFNEYINAYRLATFKEKALLPENSHLTLLGLAYESGFNSKTVFNNFFKKQEGMTPRAWLKTQRP
ncbi:helix-turn-helix domain-containing protein [Lewinella sp. W8]|nr:helix-turn-helix domain-containing protein [Lewinella sp. W8]